MHDLRRPKDCVDGADMDAFRTADADGFVDDGDGARGFDAVFGIQRFELAVQQRSERADAGFAAGWALVDVGLAVRDGFGVGAAAGVVALAALGLRQQGVDAVGERRDRFGGRRHELVQREREQCGEQQDQGEGGEHRAARPWLRLASRPSPARPARAGRR